MTRNNWYYQEIKLLPHDLSLAFVWQRLYQELHLRLVEHQEKEGSPIGFGFPDYGVKSEGFPVGERLHLFGTEQALRSFELAKALNKFSEYVNITAVQAVPPNTSFVRYKRYQPKYNNLERLARRYAKRHNISFEEALQKYESKKQEISRLPFLQLKSHSSQNYFKLFIQKEDASSETQPQFFSTYGLSKSGSIVPEL